MKKDPVERIALENGLTLQLFDKSRIVAGDRYRVVFSARIEFDLKPEYFPENGQADVSYQEIRSALGDRVTYTYENVRNFIQESEKDRIFEALKQDFLQNSRAYLSSPDFAQKLLLRKYRQNKVYTPSWLKV